MNAQVFTEVAMGHELPAVPGAESTGAHRWMAMRRDKRVLDPYFNDYSLEESESVLLSAAQITRWHQAKHLAPERRPSMIVPISQIMYVPSRSSITP